MPMIIRRYEKRDQSAVWELHKLALKVVWADLGDGPWDDDFKDLENVYINKGGEFLVGEVDGKIIALGALKKISEEVVELKRMRIHPDFQGKGLGKEMLFTLEGIAKTLGFKKIVLDTSDRQVVAQKLYEKYGYTETSRKKFPQFTMIYYEKEI